MNTAEIPWFGSGGAQPTPPPQTADDALNQPPLLVRYWRTVFRRRWLVLAIAAAVLLLGLVMTLLATPRYTAKSTIEIARQQDRVVEVEEVKPESSYVDQEFYQTQYSLLEAQSLAEAVANDLRLVEDDKFFEMFGVKPKDGGIFGSERNARLTRAQREVRMREAIKILLDNVGISPIRGSRLVTITFTSPDAVFSARVVNAWTKNFINQTLARRFEATSYARTFLENRLNQLRERLESSERALVAYAEKEQIINLPKGAPNAQGQVAESSIVADDLVALNQSLAQATADRIAAASRSGSADASHEALTNDAISAMRAKRAEIAAQYAHMLAQFEPAYPPVQALAAQLAQLDRSIAGEEARVRRSLGSDYVSASRRESQLKERVDSLKQQMLDQRRRSIQYNIYQREADTNRQLYDALLQRYKEIGVAGGVGNNNISIIDPAQAPDRSSSPRVALNLLLALIAGLGLGVAVAFLLERIDETVRDPSQVPELIGLPLLGAVPITASDEDPAQVLQDPKSPQSEAYLSIRTNLQFSTDHGVPRSLMVTSTQASEGKSTTALALAQSLTRANRGVVLVDCDLRSPSVHKLLDITNDAGTSNFLSGDNALENLLVASRVKGLSALPAGPTPPNAGELLSSPRLQMLVDELQGRFEYVIIDSPPILGLADAVIIASRVEAVVYAVEANSTRRGTIRMAVSRLLQAGITPVGAVLTKFEARKAQYGYGYDYGYGYGNKDSVT
jgi:capsular exopolysaccharide synthesis family protein